MVLLPKDMPEQTNRSKFKPIRSVQKMSNIEVHDSIDNLIESQMQSIETETKSPHNLHVMAPLQTNNTNLDVHSSFNLTQNNEENKTHTNEPTHTEEP